MRLSEGHPIAASTQKVRKMTWWSYNLLGSLCLREGEYVHCVASLFQLTLFLGNVQFHTESVEKTTSQPEHGIVQLKIYNAALSQIKKDLRTTRSLASLLYRSSPVSRLWSVMSWIGRSRVTFTSSSWPLDRVATSMEWIEGQYWIEWQCDHVSSCWIREAMLPARESLLRSERVCSSALEQEFQQPGSPLDGGAHKFHTCSV